MRKVLVQRVVNQVREKVPHARRRIFVQIVADVKAKYPGTFKHELANGKVGKRSLTKKMMDTFDNKKRTPHTTRVECEAPTLKAAYGCVQWRVSLPSNQTVESQEEIRSSLADYFSTRRVSAWDWNHIQENMKLTYASQRKDINKQAELIEKLRKEQLKRKRTGRVEGEEMEVDDVTVTTAHLADLWPFLFQPLGMKAHFNILTKTDIDENVQLFIDKTLDSLHEFCKKIVVPKEKKARKLNKKLAKKIPEGDKDKVNEWKLSAVLLMLTTYFKEDWSELILMTEVCQT
ncbi:hypothetical protein ONE63_007311 [Megalurothrips usitatus]|uniref:Uncharacterized protein n=1 Tax=Megalurothrips usitatus TaxID=439358 RepID=A0AAV7XYN9_9NEOP|nr:hypothetical protein ONE63_007311 [Megalurothrips usitatus]